MTKVEFKIDSDGKMSLQDYTPCQKEKLFTKGKLRIEDFDDGIKDDYVAEYVNGEQKRVWNEHRTKSYHIDGNYFVKTLSWDYSPEWLEWYQELQKFEPRLVEVIKMVGKRQLYMPIIKGVTLKRKMSIERFMIIPDIMNNIAKFSLMNDIIFLHHDMHFSNFMVEDYTDNIIMIDPDSFHLYDIDGTQI